MSQPRLTIVPLTFREAVVYIRENHRHHTNVVASLSGHRDPAARRWKW